MQEIEHHRQARRPELWVQYNNDCERRKWTTNWTKSIGPETTTLFQDLTSKEFIAELSALTGVDGLQADPSLHGAGVHLIEPGGWLSPHLDYALHPVYPELERRVNLILFLNSTQPTDGGAFELYDDMGANVMNRVEPEANRAVVWCPGDVEFHGTERVSESAKTARYAAAVYYLAPARPTATRKRALFVPRRVS